MDLYRVLAVVVLMALAAPAPAPMAGQAAAAASCTASLVTSFTSCLGFITNSTNGGSSPTADCCRSLAAVVNASTSCASLILAGNVPLGIPVNRTLAITLP